jgi:hypothetical protein
MVSFFARILPAHQLGGFVSNVHFSLPNGFALLAAGGEKGSEMEPAQSSE